jgi:hypothetical protein
MTPSQPLSTERLGDALDILGSYRRRLVLARVSERDEAVPISSLARELAAAEKNVPAADVSPRERERHEIRLHHVELPPLSAAGLVSYDARRGVVTSEDLPLDGEEWLEMPVVAALESWNE